MRKVSFLQTGIDWVLMGLVSIIASWGVLTLWSFGAQSDLFDKQLVLLGIAGIVMLVSSLFDYRFLRKTWVVMAMYGGVTLALVSLLVYGSVFSGAQSWFNLGFFAIQPSEFAKLVLVIVLAKYFSKRHVEIASVRHVVVSGAYAFLFFALIVAQSDFGSAIIIFCIWFGMVLLSGINWRHVLGLVGLGALALCCMWLFVFSSYQQQRIMTFISPQADLQGSGYNQAQAAIAVGSGGIWGKGVGQGTQSRLSFLPQSETDFVVAAYAEEWGFVGMLALLGLFGLVLWRLLYAGMYGETNFEMLFAGGVAVYFMSHIVIHTGINIGLLPVTGITIPFMSYGGSHLMSEALALGMVCGMRRYRRTTHRQSIQTDQSEVFTYS